MAAEDSEWERVRHMTLDQIIAGTKLAGSGTMFIGWTTPEGWPFALVVAIGSPGNEAVVPLTKQYHRVMKAACRWTEERHNTEATEGETAREPAPEPVATYLGRLPIFDPEAS